MRERGASLVEVAIALTLIALLVTLGLPTFREMMAGLRIRGVGEDMLGALQVARVEAMKRNQNVTFRIDNQAGGAWSIVLDADQTVVANKTSPTGSTVYVEGDLDTSASFNNFGLRFAPIGDDLTFAISDPAAGPCQPSGSIRCMSVIVRIGGQVRLCDPVRPAGDPQACNFEAAP